MEAISTFTGGMDSDSSQLFTKPDSYIEASAMDIILDERNGSVAITNAKGNKFITTLPITGRLQSVSTLTAGSTIFFYLRLGGFAQFTWNPVASSTNEDLYNALVANFGSAFRINYNDSNVTILDSLAPMATLWINNTQSGIVINTAREVPITPFHHPIAYGIINDDIYIISTSHTSPTGGGNGFFWKLNYNNESITIIPPTPELIYAAPLNMSTYYNMPPTAILTRYENKDIQKIYFTDFYNPLSSLNVADPEIMALDPSMLSISPKVDMYKPVLISMIDGGGATMKAGMYQAAYRMKKTNGDSSQYSEFSNMVSVVGKPMSSSYEDYIGTATDTAKILTWTVSNIDTDYNFIELVVLRRRTNGNNNSYDIKLVKEDEIRNRRSIDFVISGVNFEGEGIDVTPDQLIVEKASSWTHCKTIGEKDKMLVAGNLRDGNADGIAYDARAYRAKTPGTSTTINTLVNDIWLTNNGINFDTNLNSVSLLKPKDDVINEYYASNGDEHGRACYYRPGTNRLGGAGTNVSYEFYTIAVPADNRANDSGNQLDWAPFFAATRTSDIFNLNVNSPTTTESYSLGLSDPTPGFYNGNKNTHISGGLKGYVRGEIYRFGIQFYTREQVKLFIEWIGDIKFPDYFEPNTNAKRLNGTPMVGLNDFRLLHEESGIAYLNMLGIKFDVQNLPPNIGGYSIVRVERTEAHKTITFQGYTNSAGLIDYDSIYVGSSQAGIRAGSIGPRGIQWYALNDWGRDFGVYSDNGDNRMPGGDGTGSQSVAFLHAPMLMTRDIVLAEGMEIKFKWISGPININTHYRDHKRNVFERDHGLMRISVAFTELAIALAAAAAAVAFFCPPCAIVLLIAAGVAAANASAYAIASNLANHRYRRNDVLVKCYGTINPNNLSVNTRYDIVNPVISISGQETVGSAPPDSNGWGVIPSSPRILGSDTWSELEIADYGNPSYFYNLDPIPSTPLGTVAVINIVENNTNQYGGKDYNARSNNIYISTGHYRPINTSNVTGDSPIVYGGDIFVCLYDSVLKRKDYVEPTRRSGGFNYTLKKNQYRQINIVPLESDVNIDLMNNIRANIDATAVNDGNQFSLIESNSYFSPFSAESNFPFFLPKPNPFKTIGEWNNRFATSEPKYNGELTDSWTKFPVLDSLYDVDGTYGGINSLLVHQSKVYFWQDRSFGIAQVNQATFIEDQFNTGAVVLGTGTKIKRHDYISTISGTKHQGSTIQTNSGLYWLDSNNKRVMRMSTSKDGTSIGGLTDVKGQYAFINRSFDSSLEDKPCFVDINGNISGVTTAYDVKRSKMYLTVHNGLKDSFTLTYNELRESYTSTQPFHPKMYVYDNKNVLSFDGNTQDVYVHEYGHYGRFYGVIYKSTIKFIVNENPNVTKTFGNIFMNTSSLDLDTTPGVQINNNQDTWDEMRLTNDYQNTGFFGLIYNNNLMRKERTWKLAIPRNRVLYTNNDSPNIYTDLSTTSIQFGDRIRDKYLQVEMSYDNVNNNLLKTTAITTLYMPSSR